MRKVLSAIIISLVLLFLPWLGKAETGFINVKASRLEIPAAKAGSASELISLVNQLRAGYGLAPYKVDDALMAAAQAQSDYQAATGSASHNGEGGSSPAGRAAAYGYSGHGVVENIYTGVNLSPQQAVQGWQADGLHLNTMLSKEAEDAGAGVAENGEEVYYTLLVGSKGTSASGKSSPAGLQQPAAAPSGSSSSSTTALTTAEVPAQIETVTPAADGSIIHVVKEGQSLWNIAVAYKITLADLYAMNGLTDQSMIYPGEKLYIRFPYKTPLAATPGPSVTPTSEMAGSTSLQPTIESSPTTMVTPEPTLLPTQTSTTLTDTPQASPSPAIINEANTLDVGPKGSSLDPMLVIIGVLVLVGVALVATGSLLKRRT